MDTGSFTALLNNAVLLLALGVIYDALSLHTIKNKLLRDSFSGVLVGIIAIAVMSTPWELKPGVFFDTRWILLSLCGLFFSWRTTLIAVVIAVAYRFYQGGGGMYVGSLVIVSTSLVGVFWRRYSKKHKLVHAWWRLYLFGIAVQVTMLACMLLMPADLRWKIIEMVAVPMLLIYPVGTTLLGLILRRQADRRAAEKALLESDRILNRERGLLRGLIDAIPDLVFVKSTDSEYLGCNKAFEKFTASTEAEIQGKKDIDLFGKETAEFVRRKDLEALESGKPQTYECQSAYPDGREVWLDVYKAPFYGLDGTLHGVMGISRDITSKRAADELIWRQANFDALTSLPNRNMMRDRMEQEMKKVHRTHQKMALMFLDLDRFKEVNDTLGHDTGDLLLMEAAHRLTRAVRDTDTIARQGGDEFTIILGELDDTDHVERVANNVLSTLSEPFELGNEVTYISASIGVTFYPDDGTEIDALLKNADQAMYAAKEQGRNRCTYFTPSMQASALNRMQLGKDLRHALSDNQLFMNYQPIVELASGDIYKAEALLRWKHPERGLVSPVEFIPIAEDTGKIVDIGNWIFQHVAEQAKVWRSELHPAFQVSVNASPVQFREESCRPQDWIQCLRDLNMSGEAISVEITEGLLMETSDEVRDKLFVFRDANIQVSLDDFGTGYSSLAYLRRFDIDYLKIDKAFVNNLTSDSDDMALCEAIIVMAHKLGIKVIAEGIETQEQCDLLTAVGCDYGQGYFFAKPLDADAFEQLCREGVTLSGAPA